MKKSLLVFWAAAILALCAAPAFGGTIDTTDQITLASSPADSFVFTPTGGGGFSLALGNVAGAATGQGSLNFGGLDKGYYSILQNGATITSGGTGCGGTCITLNQNGSLLFNVGTTKGGGQLLTGFLTLVDIAQVGTSGYTNNELVVDLTVTGGKLATEFNSLGGIVQLTLLLGKGDLYDLTQTLYANIHSGTVNPLLVPEPASLALLACGLFGSAVFTRKTKLFPH